MKPAPPSPWLLAVIFLIPLSVYLSTASPTIYSEDSPETVTAGFTLGIPHPPGYPFHTLLIHFASYFAFGNPAFRYNVFSSMLASLGAVLMAVSIWLLFYQAFVFKTHPPHRRFLLNIICAIGAFFLAFSKNYWHEALSAKGSIYILQAVLNLALLITTQLLIGAFFRKAEPPDKKLRISFQNWFFMWSFLFSVSLSHHWPLQMLFIPASLLLCVIFCIKRFPSAQKIQLLTVLKTLMLVLTFTAIGISSYLYLPLRAHLHPKLDFNAPYTLHRFLSSVTRSDYRKAETKLFDTNGGGDSKRSASIPSHLREKLFYISSLLSHQLEGISLIFFIAGIAFFWKHRLFYLFLFLAVIFLTAVVVNAFYQDLTPVEFWVLNGYLLICNWIEALIAAAGIGFLILLLDNFLTKKKLWRIGLSKSIILFSSVFIFAHLCEKHYGTNDQKGDTLYYDYGLAALRSLDSNALYFSETDFDFFPSIYLRTVENKRKDTTILLTPLFRKPYQYHEVSQEYSLGLRSPDSDSPFDAISKIVNDSKRPVFYTFSNGIFSDLYLAHLPHYHFFPQGVLLRLVANHTLHSTENLFKELDDFWQRSLKQEMNKSVPENNLLLKICSHPFFNAGNYLKAKGDLQHVDWLYEHAFYLVQGLP